jgi:FkbM family methyltransferase
MSENSQSRVVQIQFPVNRLEPDGQGGFRSVGKSLGFGFTLDTNKANHNTINGWLRAGLLYESDLAVLMLRLVNPGDIVVDVGANVGFHTTLMATLVGAEGRVEAFEPSTENVNEILANLALNNFSNVRVHQDVLGEIEGEPLDFVFQPVDSGNSCVWLDGAPAGADLRPMQARTLDVALACAGQIKLVKMDIEGSEVRVLRGARELLERKAVRYWVVENCVQELRRMGESMDTLRDYMAQFGLSMFVLDWQGDFPKYIPRQLQLTSKFINNLLFAYPEDLANDWMIENIARFTMPPGFS